MTFVLLAVVTTVVTLLVTEGYGWLPWLAARAIARATRLMSEEHRERYEDEWLAELEALPTKGVASLLFALRILAAAPKTARALSERPRSPVTKHAVDLSTRALLLFLMAPLLVAMSAMVRLDSRGPILYRQTRVGRNGRLLVIAKFRTMRAEVGERNVTSIGPRTTRVGRFLRRCSLDELPRLFNVLRGEMALVGPRPRVLGEPPLEGVLANVKPGIVSWTSLAASGYLDEIEAHRRDVELATAWTLLAEVRLLLATMRAVLSVPARY